MGIGKRYFVKEYDRITVTFKFFPLGEGHIWAKLEKKLRLTSPHIREPYYCHFYYSVVNCINVVFQPYMPLLQCGTGSNQWYNSVGLKDRVQNVP